MPATTDIPPDSQSELDGTGIPSVVVPEAVPTDHHVGVPVDGLRDGHLLQFPILGANGVLLLAENSTITPRFKELLRARRVEGVLVNEQDARGMGVECGSTASGGDAPFDPELTRKLDELSESGDLFTGNTGPQFKDKLVTHGCEGYSGEQRERLVKDHAETSSLLNDMVRSAANGKPLNGGDIATVVSGYLTHLTLDSDCVVDVVNAASGYAKLAEQSLNTSLLGMSLAIEMGMDEENVRLTGLGGLLHDWGMTRVPLSIRESKKVLTQAEFTQIQKHPIHTLEMLQRIRGIPSQVPLICYQIHEQPNGRGYPRGRRNKQIHPCAGILKVADAFNALMSPRLYRSALMPYAALECLLRNAAERVYDPEIVRSLLHVMSLFPIGSTIALNDGSIARVIRRNGNNFANPVVQIIQNRDGSALTRFQVVDMSQDKRKIVRAIATPGKNEVALSPDVVVRRRD